MAAYWSENGVMRSRILSLFGWILLLGSVAFAQMSIIEQGGVVNAAGLGIFGPVIDFKDEDFETLIETNLRGIFFACRLVLPSMIERKRGHIVNIASIAGKVGSANRAVYCASKFAVVGFTESLAEEVRQHGIRAAVICPGSTDTRFSPKETSGKARDKMLRPEDVAHAVRTIVTQEPNSFISEIIMRPTQKP